MKLLAIDTATGYQSVAILDGALVLARSDEDAKGSHARSLIPTVDRLLVATGLALTGLDGLAVSIGPGSFTGLRVGLATMMGLRMVTGLPLVAVPTLEAMAWNCRVGQGGASAGPPPILIGQGGAWGPVAGHPLPSDAMGPAAGGGPPPILIGQGGARGPVAGHPLSSDAMGPATDAGPPPTRTDGPILCPMLKSRIGEVYWATYRWTAGGVLTTLSGEQVGPLAMAAASLQGTTVVLGEGWQVNREELLRLLGARAEAVREAPPEAMAASAVSVGLAAHERLSRGETAGLGLSPRYVQRTEAEVAWEKRNAGAGGRSS